MSLVAILATLRSRKRVNAHQPSSMTLPSGLTVEARADGTWLLSRAGVEPSDKEVEVIARDAKILEGYSVTGGPSKALDGKVYRLLTPLGDDMDGSEHLCKACRSRSLADDESGGGTYCPACGFGTEGFTVAPAAITPTQADAISASELLEIAEDYPNLPAGMADAALEYKREQRLTFEDLGKGKPTKWADRSRE